MKKSSNCENDVVETSKVSHEKTRELDSVIAQRRHPKLGVAYRSVYQPLLEVNHVFLDTTLGSPENPHHPIPHPKDVATSQLYYQLNILEYGFGLGITFGQTLDWWFRYLKAIDNYQSSSPTKIGNKSINESIFFRNQTTTFQDSLKNINQTKFRCKLNYISIDREPVSPCWAAHPNRYYRELTQTLLSPLTNRYPFRILNCRHFCATLFVGDFLSFPLPFSADAIFFDPFDYSVNQDGWRDEVLVHAFQRLKVDGRLATYSAATPVRRNLAHAGFLLASRRGSDPKAKFQKREMTVAAKSDHALLDFKRLKMARYKLYRDC